MLVVRILLNVNRQVIFVHKLIMFVYVHLQYVIQFDFFLSFLLVFLIVVEVSTSSTISDTYGYLYQGNFYPSYPMYNIITHDDDTAGSRQFRLTANLRSDLKYILIFTTFTGNSFGSFQPI